jgi:hypothetical protein
MLKIGLLQRGRIGKAMLPTRSTMSRQSRTRRRRKLEGQDWLAQMIERGAGELGTLATTLRSNDLQGLLGKLDELARSHPAVFVGAAMAVGFGAARLGKTAIAGASEADLPKMPTVLHEPN